MISDQKEVLNFTPNLSRDPKNQVSNLYPFFTLSVRIGPIVSFGTNVPCTSITYLNLVSYTLGRIFSNTVVIRKLWNDCHISYIFIIKCRHLVCICNWIPQFSAHTVLMWLLLPFLCFVFCICLHWDERIVPYQNVEIKYPFISFWFPTV